MHHVKRSPPETHHPFPYKIVRTQRKTTAIYIRNGIAEVRTGKRTSAKLIHQLLQNKSHWIQTKLEQSAKTESEKIVFSHGAEIPFTGKHYRLELFRAESENARQKNQVQLSGSSIRIYLSKKEQSPAEVYSQWLKQQAIPYLTDVTHQIAKQLGVLERLSQIKFRNTKTKWGHCTAKGIIQYNWLIMMAPDEIIRYLVCHEVSHLLVMNHSNAFWQTVAQLDPDYLTHRQWLKQNQQHLHLSNP